MRKLTVVENLTLDGVMETPEKWSGPYQSSDIAELNKEGMTESDAILVGRVTYQAFAAFWPHLKNDQTGIVDKLNKTTKYVVSTTMKKSDWQNTEFINDNVVETIAKIKQQPGKDIVVLGSGVLLKTLMDADLVDEYQFFVFPIVLGSGKRLFKEGVDTTGLKLTDTKVFKRGAVLLTYQPARDAKPPTTGATHE